MDNQCVCCGAVIPEGRQVCPNCENAPIRKKPMTNADRIRSMTDAELAELLYEFDSRYCSNDPACAELLDSDAGIPEEKCKYCALKWLQQPAEGD